MNTCKDCKYWGKEPGDGQAASEYIEEGFGILKLCDLPQDEFSNWIFCDYDTIKTHAAYLSGPDFGCIHWEEKK